jgi:serine/threonine protein kinase/dipeptidyl aminopeptidase/acylaminoacyl peptidase
MTLPREKWETVKALFEAAQEVDSAGRHGFLNETVSDPEIRAEVVRLLAEYDKAGDFLSTPALRALQKSDPPHEAPVLGVPEKGAKAEALFLPHNHESANSSSPFTSEQASTPDAAGESGRALSIKTRLGPYEITAFLGAGGMGEVYRARDTRLNRRVAIKVLPQVLANDRDRLRRFEQEARAIAALNHPNILALYDIGLQDGTPYVVSELLEGSTLRQQLAKGALSIRKAIEFAVQVARGLSAAHAEGVVHRDLKPENIFVTKDGRAKILDFGLAKSLSQSGALGNTTISSETEPGIVLGAAGYMSPEQVRGESVSHLSDIFSFGVVLYEMLSGRRAFKRNTNVETMNAILNEDLPELSSLQPKIPPALSRIVRHCLEKNPEERFYSARDLAFDLEVVSEVSSSTAPPALNGRRRKLVVIAAVVLGVAVGGIALGWITRSGSAQGSPGFHQLTFRRGLISNARFTVDGTTTLYSAWWNSDRSRIFMAREDSPDSLPLDPPGATLEALWPPGEMLIDVDINRKDVLARVPVTGGAPRPIFDDVFRADLSPANHEPAILKRSGGTDQIEYPPGTVIYSTAASISFLRFAPDGRSLAIVEWPVRADDAGWVTILDTLGKKRTSSSQFASIRGIAWSPNSNEVWFTGAKTDTIRNLYAISLWGSERLVYRAPSPLTLKDISAQGKVLLTRDDVRWGITGKGPSDQSERDFSWFDFSLAMDVSPDGKTLLFEEGAGADGAFVMYLRRLDGSPAIRVGTGSAQALSPDGKWILACTTKFPRQLFLVPVGTGETKTLTNDSLNHTAASWFPDGKRILFEGNEPGRPLRLYVQRIDAGPPVSLTPEGTSFVGHQQGQHMISADGNSVFANWRDGSPVIYELEGGSSHPPNGFGTDDRLIRWASDRDVVYVRNDMDIGEFPAKIYRLNVETGERVLWKELPTPDLAGFGFYSLLLTPDGKSYFYTYSRELSTLFLADGLK